MWDNPIPDVNSFSVDRVEQALKQKIETLTNFQDDPTRAVSIAFKKFDKNGSDKITLNEFVEAMKKMNFSGFEKEAVALFHRYDLDKSGTLDYKEFGGALFSRGDKILRATSVIGRIREALTHRAGGFLELRDMARQFQIMDKDKNGLLSKEELKIGLSNFLRVFNFEITRADFEKLFAAFDKNGDSNVSYDEFIRGLRGDMNERRVDLVKKCFELLDADKSGSITTAEIKEKFDVSQHPKVLRGEWTEAKAIEEFMKPWNKDGDDKIDWQEFVDYYQWISASIDSDDYFELMLRNAFHLSGGEGWSQNTTCRRVLVIHKDGRQTVEEIKNDLGISKTDIPKMIENLKSQGIDPVRIELYH